MRLIISILLSLSVYSGVFEYHPLRQIATEAKHLHIKEPYSVVYLLNADCSACIGECFSFISEVNKKHYKRRIDIVVSSHLLDVINYHISNVRIVQNTDVFPFGYQLGFIVFLVDKEYNVLAPVY